MLKATTHKDQRKIEESTKKVIAKAQKVRSREAKDYIVAEDCDSAFEVVYYYGFTAVEGPSIEKNDIQQARQFKTITEASFPGVPHQTKPDIIVEEKIALLRAYAERGISPLIQPLYLYHEGAFKDERFRRREGKVKRYGLDVIGISKSIAEAHLIQTSLSLLTERGYKNLYVEINSIGDKDSASRYGKELANYFRRNIGSMPPPCRSLSKKDVFDIVTCEHEKCQSIRENVPKSISFLSEQSRLHFKELLEYLESLRIDYRINNCLIGNRVYGSHTVFEIKGTYAESADEMVLAYGSRYNNLSKKIGMRKEIPGVGVTLCMENVSASKKVTRFKKPKFYFIQMGQGAKLKCLSIIECLRKLRVAVYHSLSKDKLVAQLTTAENLKVPYILIMGQKETMENTVLVRHMSTRSQDTVKIADIGTYIKKLK